MEKKLEVKNLVVSFRTQDGKVQAVRDISFDLNRGETLSIVGESGSGKSVTSRAVIGILAGNAIVEGGEILYDGQDLLKISEDDFHRIRGDKIAMIFQDPMSSLNPIMKVGKQLTEAMILKSRASQRRARESFNEKLKLLLENLNEGLSDDQQKANNEQCEIFNNFSVNSAKLEKRYNDILDHAIKLKMDIDNFVFLVEKKQKVDGKTKINEILKDVYGTIHPDIVVLDTHLESLLAVLRETAPTLKFGDKVSDQCISALKEMSVIVDKSCKKPKPDYFALGYYMMKNPEADVDQMPIDELNSMTYKYLCDDFLNHFKEIGAKGIKISHDKSIERKIALLEKSEKILDFFRQDSFTKKEAKKVVSDFSDQLEEAIDRLQIVKTSIEYTFRSGINSSIDRYFQAIVKNPKEEKRFQKQTEKREQLIAKGKTPDWKVVPAVVLNLELAKKDIRHIVHNLRQSLRNDIENSEKLNPAEQMDKLVDFLKAQASAYVHKVTKSIAKARALKLLEEVGIPEPRIRYRQYPFEFSGGMRQRIVIAIALSADPDILICDEPTTALDVTIQSQILELINNIKKERDLSVIFITHDLGVVANMADRIAVMYAGKIVEVGTADDIFYDPKHPYTWALLSSMPDLDTKEKLEAIPGTPPNMIFPPEGDAFAVRNKYALEIDFEKEPDLFKVSDTHYAATWLLHPDAPKVKPPKIVTDRIARTKGGQSND